MMLLAHGSAAKSVWAFQAHPDVWLLVAVLGGGYWWALRRAPEGQGASRRQVVLFCLGLLALWVHSDWPIHDISEERLLSVHMVQHTGFQLIAAPLLLVGTPAWLLRRLVLPVLRPLRLLARPLVAAVLFNGLVVATHWPVVVNAALESELLHFAVHTLLFGSSLLMWFPVLNLGRVPELPQLSEAGRMLYLFLQSVLPTVPASFFTFAEKPIYRFYAEAPRAFGLSAVDDQQLAGGLMKVYAGSILWGVIVVMFFRWYARDRREAEVLRWEDVQAELDRNPPVVSQ
ncbi:MAG: cytochrome c oxidase assembly protein [Actinomycetota bacterium]|nr:cytochrome c oxidase assembly protein [Actinomycetota bacterium]